MFKRMLVYHDEIHLLRGLAWWNGICDKGLRNVHVSRVYPLRKVKELLLASAEVDVIVLAAFLSASYPAVVYFVEWVRSRYDGPIILVSPQQGFHAWMLRAGCTSAVIPEGLTATLLEIFDTRKPEPH